MLQGEGKHAPSNCLVWRSRFFTFPKGGGGGGGGRGEGKGLLSC